jgi:hypothetical protein
MSRKVVISTSRLNRYGFRLLTEGGDLSQYEKNPILLFMHNRPWRGTKDEILAIGVVKNIKKEGDQVIGELDFDMDDPFAAGIANKWDKGIYKMTSAGITPIEFSTDPEVLLQGQTRPTLSKWRLDEVSVVDIGANDDALSIKNMATGQYIELKDGADLSFLPLIQSETEIKKPNQNQTMEKIALALGLDAKADEQMILSAIATTQQENKALRDAEEKVTLQAITAAVETAHRGKRITADQKEHFISLGKKIGLEMLSTTLAAMEPAIKPNELINRGSGNSGAGTEKKWSDLSAQEIEKLKADDFESYKLLFTAEYGFEPEIK